MRDEKKEARPTVADRAVTHQNQGTVSATDSDLSRKKIEKGIIRLLSDLFPEILLADRVTLHKMYFGYKASTDSVHKLCKHSAANWRACDNVICQTNFKIIAEAEVTLFGEVQND